MTTITFLTDRLDEETWRCEDLGLEILFVILLSPQPLLFPLLLLFLPLLLSPQLLLFPLLLLQSLHMLHLQHVISCPMFLMFAPPCYYLPEGTLYHIMLLPQSLLVLRQHSLHLLH